MRTEVTILPGLETRILGRWHVWALPRPRPSFLSFIVRQSAWLGEGHRVVFYIFRRGDKKPVLIGKAVSDPRHAAVIRREALNAFSLWEETSTMGRRGLPRPVSLEVFDDFPVYLEEAADGIGLAHRAMKQWRRKKRFEVLATAVRDAARWLWDFQNCLGIQEVELTSDSLRDLFIRPINTLRARVLLTTEETVILDQLERTALEMRGRSMPMVPGHGDFWGGSLLWSESGLRVIDWEFFQPQSLPFDDLFTLAVHPGIAIGRSGWGLLSEFSMCFNQNLFSESLFDLIREASERIRIPAETVRLLFEFFLLRMSSARDHINVISDYSKADSWAGCFRYYLAHRWQIRIL